MSHVGECVCDTWFSRLSNERMDIMIVIVDTRRPTGIGESLSGNPAFYINADCLDDWQTVENNPDYLTLAPDDQRDVRSKFPLAVERHRVIWSARF